MNAVPVHERNTATWIQVISVNLTGTYLVAKHVIGAMVQRGRGGKVIFVSSVVGLVAAPAFAPMPAYCAAKGTWRTLRASSRLSTRPRASP